MRGAGEGEGAPPACAGTEPDWACKWVSRERVNPGPCDAFVGVYGAAPGGPWPAHARARARLGARGARAREKRGAGRGRGFGSGGANARAPLAGTRPACSSRLPLGLSSSRPRPAPAQPRGRGSPALPCVCMCVGSAAFGRAQAGRCVCGALPRLQGGRPGHTGDSETRACGR